MSERATAFEIDGEVICAGCVAENEVSGFTRVQVADDATCEWCDAEHLSLMLALTWGWQQ